MTLYVAVQYIGNAIGIVVGSVVLCSSNKCTYTTAGVLYILGFIAVLRLFQTTVDYLLCFPQGNRRKLPKTTKNE